MTFSAWYPGDSFDSHGSSLFGYTGTYDSSSFCSSILGIQGNPETMSYSSAPEPSASGTNSGGSLPEPSDKSLSSLSKPSDVDACERRDNCFEDAGSGERTEEREPEAAIENDAAFSENLKISTLIQNISGDPSKQDNGNTCPTIIAKGVL